MPIPQNYVVFYTLKNENHNRIHTYVDTAIDIVQAFEHFEAVKYYWKKYDDYKLIGVVTQDYAVGAELI